MTNFQKWKSLTASLESPELFLDLSWYWAVSTALERRVYFGDLSRPHFCNMFLLFVGPPAVGKGTSMREATKLLHAFNYEDEKGVERQDPFTMQKEKLFKLLPDNLTFEKLVDILATSRARVFITGPQTAASYTAYHFALEELSSLLKRNKTEDVARFLLNLYDGEPFSYATKHHGAYTLKNCCLGFIAGTQVDFIRKAEADGLLGEGLFSRFIIAYERQPRQRVFDYPPLSEEQTAHKKALQLWLKQLSKLKGRIVLSDTTSAHLQRWWEKEAEYLSQYAEGKLANYFARRKDQVKRLAAAMHFSESISLEIPQERFDEAADLLRRLESSVIRLVNQTGRNQLYPIAERLVRDIAFAGPAGRTRAQVMAFLLPEMDFNEAEGLLEMLVTSNRINTNGSHYYATQTSNQ